MNAAAKPIPRVTPELEPFFAAARRGELAVQRCSDCGALRFPARELCSHCWSRAQTWVPVSGRGTVFSYTMMHQIYHPGFATEVPYAVAVIELEEGPHMTSNVVDCPRDKIAVGMPVEVVFEKLSDEVTLPKFRPRGA